MFQPASWLTNPHLQTLWAPLIRRVPPYPYRWERFELPDGDFVDLAWTARNDGPLVIILPGLESLLYSSPYLKGLLQTLDQQGWRGVVMHFRGCSGVPNRLLRSYHSGDTDDINYLSNYLSNKMKGTPLFVVGYSLGGNVLLKWLGEQASKVPLTAAVAISVPFQLHPTACHIKKSLGGFYQWGLLRHMKRNYRRKFNLHQGPISLTQLAKIKTIQQFDEQITAPLHGFANADDYYQQASCRQYLPWIKKPTLIIQARDDPFMPPSVIPSSGELSPTTHLEVSDKGGHVGFVSGRWPWQVKYYLELRIIQFLSQYFF
jgi:predicted alpha/beta-fold hydrolase